jgi:hypothetical protein
VWKTHLHAQPRLNRHGGGMNLTEIYLIALTIIFAVPWLVWRVFRTD